MSSASYWQESFEIAADEVGLQYTPEQAETIGEALKISHENYGLAHYSPPSSDIYAAQDREWKQKYDALQAEFDRYRGNAEEAVRKKFRVHSQDGVSIGEHGAVYSHGGRTTQLQ